MDFAFAPLNSSQDNRLRLLFKHRTDTTLVDKSSVKTVHAFVEDLKDNAATNGPFDNVLLGSHAGGFFLDLPMFKGQAGGPKPNGDEEQTTYEVLGHTFDALSNSVAFPESLFNPQVAGQSPFANNSVHIRGCNIGRSIPMLTELKRAFGVKGKLTAPKWFHTIAVDSKLGTKKAQSLTADIKGVFEYMAYEFTILTKFNKKNEEVLSRAALINLFKNHSPAFQLIDGTTVTDALWNRWVPTGKWNAAGKHSVTDKYTNVSLGTDQLYKKTHNAARQYRVDHDELHYPFDLSMASVPDTKSEVRSAFRTIIKEDPAFKVDAPFPHYLRLGYPTVDAFLDGHTWDVDFLEKPTATGANVRVTGKRSKYTVVVPIVTPANNTLIYNFYPNRGSSDSKISGLPAIENMKEDNSDFFGAV